MATWSVLSGGARSVHSVQAATESEPAVGDGIDITRRSGGGVGSILPVLRAPAGNTFTGGGFVRAWLYVPALGRFVRAPRADDDLVDAAGLDELVLPPIQAVWTSGRLALIYEGATVTGGTQLELDLVAVTPTGEGV